jgi:hypothetical protein
VIPSKCDNELQIRSAGRAQDGSDPTSKGFWRSRRTVRESVAFLLDDVEWGTISQRGRDEREREGVSEMVGNDQKSMMAWTTWEEHK